MFSLSIRMTFNLLNNHKRNTSHRVMPLNDGRLLGSSPGGCYAVIGVFIWVSAFRQGGTCTRRILTARPNASCITSRSSICSIRAGCGARVGSGTGRVRVMVVWGSWVWWVSLKNCFSVVNVVYIFWILTIEFTMKGLIIIINNKVYSWIIIKIYN